MCAIASLFGMLGQLTKMAHFTPTTIQQMFHMHGLLATIFLDSKHLSRRMVLE